MLLSRERAHQALHRIAPRAASALFTALVITSLHAQEPEMQPDRDHAPFVLHVYANLMQFPTIVLGTNLKPVFPIPRNKFDITLDSGPVFHPTQMRLEGNDPIAIAVVLDAGGTQDKIINAFAEAFSKLSPAFLHPEDHVTIYAQDCSLIRSLHDRPPDRDELRTGIDLALAAPTLHGDKPHATCKDSLPLWDTLSVVAKDLSWQPGRRVILVVSLGKESRSATSFAALASYAGGVATAVFRMRDGALVPVTSAGAFRSGRSGFSQDPAAEDLFAQLCAVTGGMDIEVSHRNLIKQLQDFVTLLRGRYVLEFPRPDDLAPINHVIVVTVPSTPTFIRSTGGSSPLPDPAILNDPNTLRSAPSPAVIGKRHALDANPPH